MSVAAPTPTISRSPSGFLSRSTGRLVWQQFRTTWLLWLIITLVTCAASWLTLFTFPDVGPTLKTLLGTGPVIFALVAPAIAFSQEYEAGTRSRMLMLPASWVQFFTVNLVCITVQTAVLFIVAWSNRILLLTFAEIELTNCFLIESGATHGPVILLAMMVGVLAALLSRRTILAVAAGGTVLVLTMTISATNDLVTGPNFAAAAVVATAVLLCANAFLARRWFHGGPHVSLAWEPATRSINCPNALLGLESGRLQTQAQRDWQALVWKATAPKWLWLLAVLALGIAMPWTPLFIALPLVTSAFGFFAFNGEQFQNRIRFLSERGISPTLVWLSKQRIWIPRMMVAIAVWPATEWLLGRNLTPGPMASASVLVLAIAGYAAGQLCSISFRRSIVALGSILLAFVAIGAWGLFVAGFGVPMWVAILPLAIGMSAASWAYCRHWVEATSGLAGRTTVLAVLATSILGSYIAVAAYRVYEIPANHVAYTDFSNGADLAPTPLRELSTENAANNTAKFNSIASRLEDRRHHIFSRLIFHRIDQMPIEWDGVDPQMKAWTKRHDRHIDAIVSIINQGELYFSSKAPPSFHPYSPIGRNRLRRQFGLHYLPLLLLEHEGSRRQAAGDYAGAEKMYAAAIRGYWLTVDSDNPGRDVQTAYAAAGHIFRRMGALGCEMESLEEPVSSILQRIRDLFEQRPALADVHRRASELELRSYEIATSAERQAVIWQENAPRSRKTVLSSITRHQGAAPRDWFTFGLRQQRIANLISRSRAATLQRASKVRASFGTHLTIAEVTWNLMLAEHGPDYMPLQAMFDNNPARWLYAETDLEADVAGACQLIDFGRAIRAATDKRAAAIEFVAERIDPWQRNRREGTLQWQPNNLLIASEWENVEHRPMFTSVGGPPDLREMPQGEGSGGLRVYPVPESVLNTLQDSK